MDDKNIEIQLIHTKAMEKDNGFGVRVLIDDEDKSYLELSQDDILHIGAILLNAARMFINYSNINNNDRTRKM